MRAISFEQRVEYIEWMPDVPLVIAEVNPDHLDMIRVRKHAARVRARLSRIRICSTIHLVIVLKPLIERFGLRRVVVTTMQALQRRGLSRRPLRSTFSIT